jgi:glycolate oxidase
MTDAALALGGTITGEHGVGSDKLPHMTRQFT